MVKFIANWMFVSRTWNDSIPSPAAINIQEITNIEEVIDTTRGPCVIIALKNGTVIPIEGDIIDVLAKFQEYLKTITNN